MRKKAKRKRRNPKVTLTYLLLMFVFIGELLLYAWCRVQYVRNKYEIAKLTTQAHQLSAMQDNLKIELARLKSPQRISRIARDKLGLITPTPKQTLLVP